MEDRTALHRQKPDTRAFARWVAFALTAGALTAPLSWSAPNGAALLEVARKAEESRTWKKALSLYNRLSGIATFQEEGTLGAARILMNVNELEQAESLVHDYLEDQNPFSVDARIALSEVYLRQKKFDAALKEAQKVETLRPKHAPAWLKKAQVYLATGDAPKAEFAASMALSQPNPSWEAHLVRAQAFARLENWKRAEKDARAVLDARPTDLDARELLSLALARLNQGAEAEREVRHALKLDANRVSTRLTLARVLALQGKTDPAIEAYRSALSRTPSDLDLGIEFARYLLDRKKSELASQELTRILALQPGHEEAMKLLFAELSSRGELDRLAPILKVFTETNEAASWARLAYAGLLLGIGQARNAEKQLDEVPDAVREANSQWSLLLAAARDRAGDSRGAVRTLRDAIKRFSQDELVRFNLAILLDRSGEAEARTEALSLYEGIQQNPTLRFRAGINSALILEGQGKTAEALQSLKFLSQQAKDLASVSSDERTLLNRKIAQLRNQNAAERYPAREEARP
jgi:Flp pilus assembly protein TadD